jgi:2-oxoglutarate ferredoxin oxidoreductase subunit gamma
MVREIRIRGQGGQGAITFGYVYGRAASIYEGRQAILTEFYGPEVTGGFAKADVVIQNKEIGYPLVNKPELLVVMSQEAWEAEKDNVREDGIVVYETHLCHPVIKEGDKRTFYGIPALEMALDLKAKVVLNVIMMAAIVEITGLVGKDALKKALLDRIPARFEELNIAALEKGYEYGRKLKEEA